MFIIIQDEKIVLIGENAGAKMIKNGNQRFGIGPE